MAGGRLARRHVSGKLRSRTSLPAELTSAGAVGAAAGLCVSWLPMSRPAAMASTATAATAATARAGRGRARDSPRAGGACGTGAGRWARAVAGVSARARSDGSSAGAGWVRAAGAGFGGAGSVAAGRRSSIGVGATGSAGAGAIGAAGGEGRVSRAAGKATTLAASATRGSSSDDGSSGKAGASGSSGASGTARMRVSCVAILSSGKRIPVSSGTSIGPGGVNAARDPAAEGPLGLVDQLAGARLALGGVLRHRPARSPRRAPRAGRAAGRSPAAAARPCARRAPPPRTSLGYGTTPVRHS